MNTTQKFINDMKAQYGMDDGNVLQAIQEDSQHEFIMTTQGVTEDEATEIIENTERHLMETLSNPFL